VAQDGDEVVFLEVRSRRSADYGTPEESLTAAKLRRLLATAQHYLQQRGKGEINWRIDLVSVRLG
jgi:putative endonuclease